MRIHKHTQVWKHQKLRGPYIAQPCTLNPNSESRTLTPRNTPKSETFEHTQVWKHQNLRVSYIAQHSMHHLEDNLLLNPITYIQKRFFQGRDKELAKMAMVGMTEADHAAMAKKGNISEIVGRAVRGKSLCYQVKKSSGRGSELSREHVHPRCLCKMPGVCLITGLTPVR